MGGAVFLILCSCVFSIIYYFCIYHLDFNILLFFIINLLFLLLFCSFYYFLPLFLFVDAWSSLPTSSLSLSSFCSISTRRS